MQFRGDDGSPTRRHSTLRLSTLRLRFAGYVMVNAGRTGRYSKPRNSRRGHGCHMGAHRDRRYPVETTHGRGKSHRGFWRFRGSGSAPGEFIPPGFVALPSTGQITSTPPFRTGGPAGRGTRRSITYRWRSPPTVSSGRLAFRGPYPASVCRWAACGLCPTSRICSASNRRASCARIAGTK